MGMYNVRETRKAASLYGSSLRIAMECIGCNSVHTKREDFHVTVCDYIICGRRQKSV